MRIGNRENLVRGVVALHFSGLQLELRRGRASVRHGAELVHGSPRQGRRARAPQPPAGEIAHGVSRGLRDQALEGQGTTVHSACHRHRGLLDARRCHGRRRRAVRTIRNDCDGARTGRHERDRSSWTRCGGSSQACVRPASGRPLGDRRVAPAHGRDRATHPPSSSGFSTGSRRPRSTAV